MSAPALGPTSEVDRVAAAILACPGVAGLHGGGRIPVATYLPGRRVVGVRLDPDRIHVSISVFRGSQVPSVVADLRASLVDVADGRPVDVLVADVQEPPIPLEAAPAPAAALPAPVQL